MPAGIEDPIFQPAYRVITAITQANPATVTTSFAHDYFTGDIIRLLIPTGFGMVQADKLFGNITVTSTTQFTIPINTIAFDAFSDPSNGQISQSVPIGEINSTLFGATENTLPTRVR